MTWFHLRLAKLFMATTVLATSLWQAQAQTNYDKTILVTATVVESPPAITLEWTSPSTSAGTILHQKIWRRLKGESGWGYEFASLTPADLVFVDTEINQGVEYEYRLVRIFDNAPFSSTGYITAGIRVPQVDRRGKLLLVADSSLVAELDAIDDTLIPQFKQNLIGDGWEVVMIPVSPSDAIADVKAEIETEFYSPSPPRAVLLLGDVPVPYSGNINPDGHPNHQGAWPADVYYAEFDMDWTPSADVDVDTRDNPTQPSRAANVNIPGDGKFDHSVLSSDVDIEIGRVDLSAMPLFGSQAVLIQRYLQRNHDYRFKTGGYTSVPRRGLMDGGLLEYRGEDTFASNAWWNFTPVFGSANIYTRDWFGTLQSNDYLFALAAGGGSYTSCSGVGTSTDFSTRDSRAVFNLMLGSYFGDWDNSDNLLRAPLAGTPGGLGLASMWTGRPHWHLHHMALGETLGYATRLSQNNAGEYSAGFGARSVHIALMGDPTLRLFPVLPPTGLSSQTGGGTPRAVELSWTASAEPGLLGYAVYRADSPDGPFSRLNGELVTTTSFIDRTGTPGQPYTWQVKAVKLETSASGTYLNPSQGIFVEDVVDNSGGSLPEISVEGNGQPIASGDTGSLTANSTDFGSAEIDTDAIISSFTVRNLGNAVLNVTGSVTLSDVSPSGTTHFSILSQPAASLQTGESTGFQIEFAPTGVGTHEVQVTIPSDDPDESNYTFVLTGEGTPNVPVISVAASHTESLPPGTTSSSPLTITNDGLGELSYEVTAKYTWRDSNQTGGPVYDWIDIAETGTEVTNWTGSGAPEDNGRSSSLALGFSFPFFDKAYSTLVISTEGFLVFENWIDAPTNTGLPNLAAPGGSIAVCWDDLWDDSEAAVYYQAFTNYFVVQFDNLRRFDDEAERVTCQAIIYADGEILLQYESAAQLVSNSYTIGIHNHVLNDGLQVAYNQDYLTDGLAVRISPPATTSWLTVVPSASTVAPLSSTDVNLSFDPSGLPGDRFFSTLEIRSNDPAQPSRFVDIILDVITPIKAWRLAEFGTTENSGTSADDANPDDDFATNLWEYALGTDPLIFDALQYPTIEFSGYLEVATVFRRVEDNTDLIYELQASSDMQMWVTIARSEFGEPTVNLGAVDVIESGATPLKEVSATHAIDSPFRFFRLQIQRPPFVNPE